LNAKIARKKWPWKAIAAAEISVSFSFFPVIVDFSGVVAAVIAFVASPFG